MKFAVVGGDRRSALLCALLSRDGHKVYSFALEKAELPEEVPRAGCLQGCVYGADCVILPVPAEKGGLLNSPLSSETLRMPELIGALWKGQILCGGRFSDAMLCLAPAGTLLLELASPPGGFDRNLAENIGLKTVAAPGLPGKCAPYTAAELLRDTVYDIIKEQEE